jgi:hypothetical protein
LRDLPRRIVPIVLAQHLIDTTGATQAIAGARPTRSRMEGIAKSVPKLEVAVGTAGYHIAA